MALAVGDRVYLNVNGGLRSDPPLFGRVDVINGNAPDVLRINWENGANQIFSSTTPSFLEEFSADPNEGALLGSRVAGLGAALGIVVRSWMRDPDGANERTLMFVTPDGLYGILPVAQAGFYTPLP